MYNDNLGCVIIPRKITIYLFYKRREDSNYLTILSKCF
uniref:Uncharacterized protein n=1 Tax=virus sp. ctmTa7 TaxID=2828255 RepID=A0A8S5RD23_9VIRU|nr:MAG TPA: hypothetical protein [virus sp. ctmTa7]